MTLCLNNVCWCGICFTLSSNIIISKAFLEFSSVYKGLYHRLHCDRYHDYTVREWACCIRATKTFSHRTYLLNLNKFCCFCCWCSCCKQNRVEKNVFLYFSVPNSRDVLLSSVSKTLRIPSIQVCFWLLHL